MCACTHQRVAHSPNTNACNACSTLACKPVTCCAGGFCHAGWMTQCADHSCKHDQLGVTNGDLVDQSCCTVSSILAFNPSPSGVADKPPGRRPTHQAGLLNTSSPPPLTHAPVTVGLKKRLLLPSGTHWTSGLPKYPFSSSHTPTQGCRYTVLSLHLSSDQRPFASSLVGMPAQTADSNNNTARVGKCQAHWVSCLRQRGSKGSNDGLTSNGVRACGRCRMQHCQHLFAWLQQTLQDS